MQGSVCFVNAHLLLIAVDDCRAFLHHYKSPLGQKCMCAHYSFLCLAGAGSSPAKSTDNDSTREGFGMELTEDVVTRLLSAIAAERGDSTAENALMVVARMDDGRLRRELLIAIADGLGVPLV